MTAFRALLLALFVPLFALVFLHAQPHSGFPGGDWGGMDFGGLFGAFLALVVTPGRSGGATTVTNSPITCIMFVLTAFILGITVICSWITATVIEKTVAVDKRLLMVTVEMGTVDKHTLMVMTYLMRLTRGIVP